MKSAVLLLAVIATARANFNPLDGITDIRKKSTEAAAKALEGLKNIGEDALKSIPKTPDDLKVRRKTIEQMVKEQGYKVETYNDVKTEDGYILTMYRIPEGRDGKKPTKTVLLQHGLMACCTDWLLFGKERSLGYILADLGFDVWLANCRGNYYSRNHTKYNPDKDAAFWAFSWHEIGMYDIPAMIDYILAKTGEKQIYHVGHSQGTTSFYVMTSMRPEYADKITHHVSLAPIGFMNHLKSPLIQLFAGPSDQLGAVLKAVGTGEFMAEDSAINFITDIYCSNLGLNKIICKNALFMACGFNDKQMPIEEIPIIMAYYPSSVATNQMVHYGQEVKSKRFCQFDFGFVKNNKIYMGRLTPPDYELEKITANMTMIYSENDWLSHPIDVERLENAMVNANVKKILAPLDKCNHLDYLFGKDAAKTIYPVVIKILQEN
uniref:Lipase n=1 Tax=Diabrotica virgifera virgifera TaxID=50390 RepID=A0A6P7H6L8_DIAVI